MMFPRLRRPNPLAPSAVPLRATEIVGPVLALIPHADDETLGCGGLLANLLAAGRRVDFVLVTDCGASHGDTRLFARVDRRAVREREFREAVALLGAPPGADVVFWRKPDAELPLLCGQARQRAVDELAGFLTRRCYQTVLTPWRRDPHGDHAATTSLLRKALRRWNLSPRVLEYCVWLGLQGDSAAAYPLDAEPVRVRSLDVSGTEDVRARALAAHRSQLSADIFGDPEGFVLPPDLRARVDDDTEYYIEELE